jgi:hypothetical protein
MPKPTTAAIVRHPQAQVMEVLNPAKNYDPSDPLVRAYPWAFEEKPTEKRASVPIEAATAEPGEKRARR